MYRLLNFISGIAFRVAHWAQWQSTKCKRKKRHRKHLTNVVGYAYDYIVGKIRQTRAERNK